MQEHIDIIKEKDPIFYAGLEKIIKHFADCYSDKYCGEVKPIEMREFIFNMGDMSKGYNIGNACKYITRVTSEGFEKSDNDIDIVKGAHYLCFEYARRVKETQKKDFYDKLKTTCEDIHKRINFRKIPEVFCFEIFGLGDYIEWLRSKNECAKEYYWSPFLANENSFNCAKEYKVGFDTENNPITLERIYEDRT